MPSMDSTTEVKIEAHAPRSDNGEPGETRIWHITQTLRGDLDYVSHGQQIVIFEDGEAVLALPLHVRSSDGWVISVSVDGRKLPTKAR